MSSKLLPDCAATMENLDFRRVCGRFATGVVIATVRDAQMNPHGMTINSFTSVSLEPPLILLCVDHRASLLQYFRAHTHFGVNILREDQRELADHFARKGHDRFGSVEWHPGETGVPLLPHVLATLECSRKQRVTAGDHDIVIGEVLHARVHEGHPLVYFASRYRALRDF